MIPFLVKLRWGCHSNLHTLPILWDAGFLYSYSAELSALRLMRLFSAHPQSSCKAFFLATFQLFSQNLLHFIWKCRSPLEDILSLDSSSLLYLAATPLPFEYWELHFNSVTLQIILFDVNFLYLLSLHLLQ